MGDSETSASANISSYAGFNTFKNDFILEGNTTRQLYSDPINTDVILLGDVDGDETTIVAKTLRWGVNTVHPDNTPTVGGRMELPLKWGRNGTFLGINGGLIDWIDIFNVENNNIFGFANYGTRTVQNKAFNLLTMNNLYNTYRYENKQEQLEGLSFTGTDLSEVKISSTIGLFCDSSGFSSTAIGWQNNTNQIFSTLVGTNLDLSSNSHTDTIGEIIVGHSNKLYNERDNLSEARVFTVGNGSVNNQNTGRSDAFYILKNANAFFNNGVSITGQLNVLSNSNLYGNVTLHDSLMDCSFLKVDSTFTCTAPIKTNVIELDEVVSRDNDVDNIGRSSGKLNLISKNGIHIKKYHINNNLNYVDHSTTNNLTHDKLAKNSFILDNTSGIQIFTTRAADRPSEMAVTNYGAYSSEQHNKEAYGGIQILHPDAYNHTNMTGIDGSGIYPPTIKPCYRGTNISWFGVSSEEIKCNTINVNGLNMLPTTRNENTDSANYHIGRSDLVLGSNGDGTVEWRPVDLGNSVNLTLIQLFDTYNDTNNFTYLGRSSETASTNSNGMRMNMLIVDFSANIGSTLNVEDDTNIHGDVLITGKCDISKNVTIDGDIKSHNITSSGSFDLCNNAVIDGFANIGGDVNIHGNTTIVGNIFSDNNLSVNGTGFIGDNTQIEGDLDVTGALDLSGNINSHGGITVKNDANFHGNCNIENNVDTNSNIICGNNLYFKNTSNVTEDELELNGQKFTSFLQIITQQVGYAIANSITNPAGSIIWFARTSVPNNYAICNGQYFNKIQFSDLFNVLPPYVSTIVNDAQQNILININDNLSFSNTNDNVSFSLNDVLTKKHHTLGNGNYLSTKSVLFINNSNIRVDISNAAQNLKTIKIKITSLPSGNYREQDILWSSLSNTYISNGLTTNAFFDISSNTYSNSSDTTFNLEVMIEDTNDYVYEIYKTTDYNKTGTDVDKYIEQSHSLFKTNFFKIPDLLGKFIKGSETGIGEFYEDSIKDHHHTTQEHTHDVILNKFFPHAHNSSSILTGATVSDHRHNIPLSFIDATNSGIEKSNNDISLVIMPTNENVNQETTYQNTDLRGGHTIAGTVTTSVDVHNLHIDFNEQTQSSQADVAGIVDTNKQPIALKTETAPKHMKLMPCIALGGNTGEENDINFSFYSNERRLDFIEKRLANMDICMNTHMLNVHSFTNNPSGIGI